MNDALLSIIVTVYNVSPFLRRCVDSILSQSYKNLELILVDDGSTDGSGALCDELAVRDSRVRVIHQENGGAAAAKNAGLRAAAGDYLGIVDGDDWIEPDMYALLISALCKEKASLAMCGYRIVSEAQTGEVFPGSAAISRDSAFERLFSTEDVLFISPCNKLYSKALYESLVYPVGKRYEDEFVTHTLLDRIEKIAVVNAPLYNYRQRERSLTHSAFTVRNLDQVEAYYDRYRFLKSKNMQRFIPAACERFSDFYIEAKKQFHPQTEPERARMKQIDEEARQLVHAEKSACSAKVCFRLSNPTLYCTIGKWKTLLLRHKNG